MKLKSDLIWYDKLNSDWVPWFSLFLWVVFDLYPGIGNQLQDGVHEIILEIIRECIALALLVFIDVAGSLETPDVLSALFTALAACVPLSTPSALIHPSKAGVTVHSLSQIIIRRRREILQLVHLQPVGIKFPINLTVLIGSIHIKGVSVAANR